MSISTCEALRANPAALKIEALVTSVPGTWSCFRHVVDAQKYLLSEQTVSHSHRDYFLHCSRWRCRHPLSSLLPRPASGPCLLPALSHQHPGYTAGWRGPLFGTAPHQDCLKPVKLVFMMPGRLPFPRPPITQVNKRQAPAGPLGQVLRLLHPQIHKTTCRSARTALPHAAAGGSLVRVASVCSELAMAGFSRTSSHLLPSTQNAANKAQRGSPRSPATQCQ